MIFLFKREIERKFLKKKGEEYQRKKIFRLNLYLDLNIHISIIMTYLLITQKVAIKGLVASCYESYL